MLSSAQRGIRPFPRLGQTVFTVGLCAAALLAVTAAPATPLPGGFVAAALILILAVLAPFELVARLAPVVLGGTPAIVFIAVTAGGTAGAVVVPLALAFLLIAFYRRPMPFRVGAPELAVALFALVLAAGALHGDGPGVPSLVLRSLVPFFLAWLLGRAIARTSGGQPIWWAAVIFVSVSAFAGILEAGLGRDLVAYPRTELVVIGDAGYARPNGFASSDIDFALSMLIGVALVLGGPYPGSGRRLAIPVALLGSVAVVLASFRSGWIVLALIWLVWTRGRGVRFWVLAVAGLLASLPLLQESLTSLVDSPFVQERVLNRDNITGRATVFNYAWQIFLDNPLTGIGLNAYRVDPLVLSDGGSVVTPHNIWLGTLAELGLVGGLALLAMAVTSFLAGLRVRARDGFSRIGMRGVAWACLVLFAFSFSFQVVTVPLAMLLSGLALGALRGAELSGPGQDPDA